MRALGLAPMNEELDNAVTVFLLAPHWLGGGGMGDQVIKCVQDSAITILAGLQYDNVAVRANYENLLTHAGDCTRDIFSVRGDPTAVRRLQFLRHHAELQIHRGKQHVPAPRQAFKYQPSQIFNHDDFTFSSKELSKDTAFHYLPVRDPVVLIKEPKSHTSRCSSKTLPVEASEVQTRAQSSTMVPGILWIGLNAIGKQQFMAIGCVSAKVRANLSEEESIRSTHSDDCFLRATANRSTAERYAYGTHGNESGSVLKYVCLQWWHHMVRRVNRKKECADLNIAGDSRAVFFARKEFETLLLVPNLSTVHGHILAHLDIADLKLSRGGRQRDKPTLTADEVFLSSSVDEMRKHNTMAALAFQKQNDLIRMYVTVRNGTCSW